MPFQRGKWENLLPFPQLVEEGFSVAAEDQVRWNILRLSLDSWKQKRCETQGYLDEEVKPPPSLGQLWSAWRWVQRWNLPWQWCWWGTCFGPNGKQEVSLEEINSLGLPLPFFLGFVSLELHVQKGQEWCGWNISVSVLGCWRVTGGLCRTWGNLETPTCNENPGNEDQAEHLRRDPHGVLFS